MKQQLTHSISKEIAKRSANVARNLSGWRKWILAAIAAIAGALAWFTQGGGTIEGDISPASPLDTLTPAP